MLRTEPSSTSLVFTAAERKALEARQHKTDLLLQRMAATSREESERLARGFFDEIAAKRRVTQARKMAPAATRPTRPGRTARIGRTSKAVRTVSPSRGDPDDDPHEQAGTYRRAAR